MPMWFDTLRKNARQTKNTADEFEFECKIPKVKSYAQFKRFSESIHLLIAGTTGCGKSNLLDGIICELLHRIPFDKDGVELILIDPKMVELSKYKDVPHCIGYADNNDDILYQLDRTINIMMSRYDEMRSKGINDYDGCHLYVIVDELGDLMTTCKKDAMPKLQRIAQLGRAARVHLFVASQSPARKIIPAELQINFPSKIAMSCASNKESRQIIDIPRIHAEELPTHGKVYYLENKKVFEVSIPLVDKAYVQSLVNHWKTNFRYI